MNVRSRPISPAGNLRSLLVGRGERKMPSRSPLASSSCPLRARSGGQSGIVMVIREWHMASWCCERLYQHGFFKRLLEKGRYDVRRFEDLIYGFYHEYPGRFIPICVLEALYHLFGVAEVWYILTRISTHPSFTAAFLLESISRLVTVVFKLVPFLIGVDEAGARFVGESLALAAGVGVTLAVIRKGRILFWSVVGIVLLIKRGLSIQHIHQWLDSPETDEPANA